MAFVLGFCFVLLVSAVVSSGSFLPTLFLFLSFSLSNNYSRLNSSSPSKEAVSFHSVLVETETGKEEEEMITIYYTYNRSVAVDVWHCGEVDAVSFIVSFWCFDLEVPNKRTYVQYLRWLPTTVRSVTYYLHSLPVSLLGDRNGTEVWKRTRSWDN